MRPTLAEIFRRTEDPASFRAAVEALGGDYPLASADMIALGEAYFERSPDRAHDRNAADVLAGYAMARAVLIEKALLAVDPSRRAPYRLMLNDVAQVGPAIAALAPAGGPAGLSPDHEALQAALTGLKAVIDEIPKGPIKERFVGGISNLFNILYVFKMRLGGPLLSGGALLN